ncbi:MAG: excinuclease ABC subunit UvrC [Lachnospiraceae bacterium]|nr:excinuclease ABC subunit UvrC [Lachnospiraceae bacterium]
MEKLFDIQEELHKLPHEPGVYIMHDKSDAIIYVGKAKDLHNRVRSYFRTNVGRGPWIDRMVSLIAYFEYILTDSEMESLVLENNLIKEYRPKYNTMLMDDKTYPMIKVTFGEDFPRVMKTRQMKKDRSRYFGPYPGELPVNSTIELINKLFGLRTCNKSIKEGVKVQDRPCLNYQMGLCSAPCVGYISKQEYMEKVEKAVDLLTGNCREVVAELEQKMAGHAENMEYEEAAAVRDMIANVKAVGMKQKMTDSDGEDKDIIAMAGIENDVVVQVFFVRDGKLIGREHFYMRGVEDREQSEILGEFVKQFYAGTPFIPREIMLQQDIEDRGLLESWLSERRGSRTYIVIPKIGTKEKLVELAAKNAMTILKQDRDRIKREEGRTIGAVKEIEELTGIRDIKRMEAFDISNISGFENVGSMVVFERGKPKKSDYRKFKIKTVSGPDDYACMKEVLTRRFTHGIEENREMAEKGEDAGFGSFTKYPDVLLMDGGKGQVNIALRVLEELKLDIPVCGMVKDDNHRTRGLYYNNEELPIDTHSEGFKLITRIQDEAHRFAIEYHRSLRSRDQVRSVLDNIPGVGETRRKALMRSFDSIEDIKNADPERLAELPEIPFHIAEEIYRYFHSTGADGK